MAAVHGPRPETGENKKVPGKNISPETSQSNTVCNKNESALLAQPDSLL
jgi:hypothetical protein